MKPDVIFDNHLHLRRNGRYLEAVKDFKRAGGTHFILCQYPMPDKALSERSYLPCYMDTIKMAEEVERETGIKVFVTIGPYPADYLLFKEKLGKEGAMDLMKKGMEEAARLCAENKRCVGIGEIGRPHFKVEDEIIEESNEIMIYGMQCAKEVGVPVVLHTEKATPSTFKELAEMAKKVGLRPEKVVKHFSPPFIYYEENHGLMPSVISSRNNIEIALSKGDRFLMETDYIDDPNRPGAVLGPKTVPRLTKRLIKEGKMEEEQYYKVHVDNPERTYGIDLQ